MPVVGVQSFCPCSQHLVTKHSSPEMKLADLADKGREWREEQMESLTVSAPSHIASIG